MAISSPGIGSGLDVKSIVSQLMALERKPLEQLQSKASNLQTKLSAFGQLKSQVANLQDQIGKLTATTAWNKLSASSTNSQAVSATTTDDATAGSWSVVVSQLAAAQVTASQAIGSGTSLEGRLSITLGQWTDNQFSPASESEPVTIDIGASDTLAQVAESINRRDAGVNASIVTDASGSRLVIQSKETGATTGFKIEASNLGPGSELSSLAYDPENGSSGTTLKQAGLDTLATVNNVEIASPSLQFDGAIAGLKLTVSQVTTSPVTISVNRDTSVVKSAINSVVESYNALSKALAEMTKYDQAAQSAGSLQGDATALGLATSLRRQFTSLGGSNGSFDRLSDIGVTMQLDGTLAVDNAKLSTALQNTDELKAFFIGSDAESANGGLATRLKAYTQGLLDSSEGTLTYRNKALQTAVERNNREQEKFSDRLTRTEQRLNAQYSRLDSTLGTLSALSAYVTQQVTLWNNQKNS